MAANGLVQNVKIFPDPFAYVLYNAQAEYYCSYCLCRPSSKKEKLHLCTGCRLARYCDRECQRQAWIRDHKLECPRLKSSFPHLPLTDVLFLARIMEKLRFIQTYGDVHNWEKHRSFRHLISHENETRKDSEKMARFERLYEKTRKFMRDELIEKDEFFLLFCRVWINSHSLHAAVGMEIGMALDLGISKYDHNCRPNAALIYDGFKAIMRPLIENLDVSDHTKTFISYVDVGRSKFQRRRQLWNQWYFWCQCERCMDSDDDRLTSIRCTNPSCTHAVIITEEFEPIDIQCPDCHSSVSKAIINQAQELMNAVPSNLSLEHDVDKYRCMLDTAKQILHPDNIYLCRLITAYTEMTHGQDPDRSSVDELVMAYETYKKCYPSNHRHMGYHLLHLIKALIKLGYRSEATPYAYEATNIFEICFGLEHPYYLKTLALWTYLDTGSEKSDDQLLELMNFNFNRPINLSALIETKV